VVCAGHAIGAPPQCARFQPAVWKSAGSSRQCPCLVQRHQHVLFGELADPGQIHGDDVVAACLAFGVAQRFLVQPVDGKGALVNVVPTTCSNWRLRLSITMKVGSPCTSTRTPPASRSGITQNNVGVDSYQTTYGRRSSAPNIGLADVGVDNRRPTTRSKLSSVLDAGGDVARQIAQIEDLIQQEVDAIIIWPTNGEAVIPAVRKAHQAGSR
jgi:hypothetical protein